MKSQNTESESLTTTSGPGPVMDRRRFMTVCGTCAGAAAVGTRYPAFSPVGSARALPPLAAYAAGVTAAYVAREVSDYLTGESYEGLENYVGGEALHADMHRRAREQQSADESVFVGFANHLEDSQNAALSHAKAAAINAINENEDDATVHAQAAGAIEDYYATLQKNVLGHWNEQIEKIQFAFQTAEDHDEVEGTSDLIFMGFTDFEGVPEIVERDIELTNGETHVEKYFDEYYTNASSNPYEGRQVISLSDAICTREDSITVQDEYEGSSFDNRVFLITYQKPDDTHGQETEGFLYVGGSPVEQGSADGGQIQITELWDEIPEQRDDAMNNIDIWIDNVLQSVEAGDIDLSDVMDPATFSAHYAADEDSHYAWAAADLVAIGVPLDLDGGEALIRLEESGWEARGLLGVGDREFTDMAVGETYDPENIDGPVYLVYDGEMSERELDPDDYDGMNGTTLTLYDEPEVGTLIQVMIDGTGYVQDADSFSEGEDSDGNPYWEAEYPDETEDAEIDGVYVYTEEGTESGMTQIDEPFTILEYFGSDGEEVDSVTFSDPNYQTAENFITQEEWDEWRDAQEGFDEYDEGGAGGGFGDIDGGMMAALGAIAALIVAVVLGR